MKKCIAMMFRIALVCGGIAVAGSSQVSVIPAPGTLTAPVVEVVGTASGSAVQTAETGFGSLSLGHVAWSTRTSRFGLTHIKDRDSFTVSTGVTLRLQCPAADLGRRGSIAAFLRQADTHYLVSLDEFTLSTAAVVINPLIYCGATAQHTFAVRVPVSAPSGPLAANIGFQVTLW
jgi:hypothetical protein